MNWEVYYGTYFGKYLPPQSTYIVLSNWVENMSDNLTDGVTLVLLIAHF